MIIEVLQELVAMSQCRDVAAVGHKITIRAVAAPATIQMPFIHPLPCLSIHCHRPTPVLLLFIVHWRATMKINEDDISREM